MSLLYGKERVLDVHPYLDSKTLLTDLQTKIVPNIENKIQEWEINLRDRFSELESRYEALERERQADQARIRELEQQIPQMGQREDWPTADECATTSDDEQD